MKKYYYNININLCEFCKNPTFLHTQIFVCVEI